MLPNTQLTQKYLESIGIPVLPAKTIAFDPGYDVATVKSHLQQSGHLMSSLKLSMACWQICNEEATREKIACAKQSNVAVCTGGGPFEVACACDKLPEYLDLCASLGFDRIEAGEGFINLHISANEVLSLARERGLKVHFEVGEKHSGAFTDEVLEEIIETGKIWLDAGATQLVVEAREDAENVGLFNEKGNLDFASADRLVEAFGLENIVFEAPNKSSQFAFLQHYGTSVELCNVRLEELLRVEIYRRGLHSDAFQHLNLRPKNANSTHLDIK